MRVYAHIGYPKCASTWLQNQYFPKHPEVRHWGRRNGDEIDGVGLRALLWSRWICEPDFLYDAEEARRTIGALVDEAAGAPAIKACGLSQELLSVLLQGRLDVTTRAKRLADALPDGACVVIVIREQRSWITSLYRSMVHDGGVYDDFERFVEYMVVERDVSPLASLMFDRMQALYADLFGGENVLVLPYELLRQDARRFTETLSTFLGVDPAWRPEFDPVNKTRTDMELSAYRAANRNLRYNYGGSHLERPMAFTVSDVIAAERNTPAPQYYDKQKNTYMFMYTQTANVLQQVRAQVPDLAPLDLHLPERFAAMLDEVIRPSNAALQAKLDIDLAALGYRL